MNKTRILDGLVIAFVLLGLGAVAGGVVLEVKVASHIGFTLWWLAFSAVVVENYAVRRPVQTRGGMVRKEDGAFRYALPYVFFGVMILLSGIMVIAMWLTS